MEIEGRVDANDRYVTNTPTAGPSRLREQAERAACTAPNARPKLARSKSFRGWAAEKSASKGRDGRWRDSDTVAPGDAPCPPKDKRR